MSDQPVADEEGRTLGEVSRNLGLLRDDFRTGVAELKAELGRYVARESHDKDMSHVEQRLDKIESSQSRLLWAILGLVFSIVVAVVSAVASGAVG